MIYSRTQSSNELHWIIRSDMKRLIFNDCEFQIKSSGSGNMRKLEERSNEKKNIT